MSEFDPTKPVQTRNGCEVRIICTDRAHSTYPIIGLVKGDSGEESALYVRKDGRTYNHSCPLDFINIPEEMWTNVLLGQGEKLFAKPRMSGFYLGPYKSKEEALNATKNASGDYKQYRLVEE